MEKTTQLIVRTHSLSPRHPHRYQVTVEYSKAVFEGTWHTSDWDTANDIETWLREIGYPYCRTSLSFYFSDRELLDLMLLRWS